MLITYHKDNTVSNTALNVDVCEHDWTPEERECISDFDRCTKCGEIN